MQVGLHQFRATTIEWLKETLRIGSGTRTSVARELCAHEDWRNVCGQFCVSAATKALPVLASKLGLALPAARRVENFAAGGNQRLADYPDLALQCRLRDLGAITLEPVADAADKRRWESMMATHHPQGWSRAPGGQMRYWVGSAQHGCVGGIGFSSAGWHQQARDTFIGWSADARAANLPRLICNHRFLLLPGVRVHGLASGVLRMAGERVAQDWEAAYGVRPVLAFTYIGANYSGRSYRAARWRCCPQRTKGRPPGCEEPGEQRSVWMKPLSAGWREILCEVPRRVIGAAPAAFVEDDADWASREYGRCSHSDGRIRDRIVRMGRSWLRCLGKGLPVIFPEKAEQKAAYRLLSNEKVTMDHILDGHKAMLVERCGLEQTVLAIQDTTTVNYDLLTATEGLVGLGGGGKGSSGVVAHTGLAVTLAGRPLGVFELDATFRDGGATGDDKESVRWLAGIERAQELAAACPATRVITVCDREGDFWGLLSKARADGAALLVRASRSAQRQVLVEGGGKADLWDHVAATPQLATRQLALPACGGKRARKKRTAKIGLRATEVLLAPPQDAADREPIRMLAVSATETGGSKDPVHWLLLTTEGLNETADDRVQTAWTVIDWYVLRWTIELYFKVLKSGTRIEDRRLDHADDLRKCLAFDAITACHVFDLERMAREAPDTPANKVVTQDEIDVLQALLKAQGHRNARAPPPANARHSYPGDQHRAAGRVSSAQTATATGNEESLGRIYPTEMGTLRRAGSQGSEDELITEYNCGEMKGARSPREQMVRWRGPSGVW